MKATGISFGKLRPDLVALLCGAALAIGLLAGVGIRARADSPSWEVSQFAAAPDGSSRVLWESAGSINNMVSIWKLDAAGKVAAMSAVYGPYIADGRAWYPMSIVIASDGSTSVLWTRNGANGVQLSIWRFDSSLKHVATGPVYGPFSDANGDWSPYQFAAGPNGTTRLLWTDGYVKALPPSPAEFALSGINLLSSRVTALSLNAGAEVSVWAFDQNGNATSKGPAYGPYSDTNGNWVPVQYVTAPNGTGRLMWMESGNEDQAEVSFWALSANGIVSHYGHVYGPYAGWNPLSFDINSSDNTLRLLWDKYSGPPVYGDIISTWLLDANGTALTMGPPNGPYDVGMPNQIYANADGTSEIVGPYLTPHANGPLSFWTMSSAGVQTGATSTYGQYSNWYPRYISRNPATGDFRVLWLSLDSEIISQWSLSPTGRTPAIGPIYGPYSYAGQ